MKLQFNVDLTESPSPDSVVWEKKFDIPLDIRAVFLPPLNSSIHALLWFDKLFALSVLISEFNIKADIQDWTSCKPYHPDVTADMLVQIWLSKTCQARCPGWASTSRPYRA